MKNVKPPSPNRGFTLMELMIAIAILSILIVIAVPSISETIKNNQIAAQNNELIALINLARNEAIRRNIPVTDDGIDNDGVQVRLTAGTSGWTGVVIVPTGAADQDLSCNIDNAIRCANFEDGILGSDVVLTFNNRGYLAGLGEEPFTLIHERCTSPRQARKIRISPVGQIESAQMPCSGEST